MLKYIIRIGTYSGTSESVFDSEKGHILKHVNSMSTTKLMSFPQIKAECGSFFRK